MMRRQNTTDRNRKQKEINETVVSQTFGFDGSSNTIDGDQAATCMPVLFPTDPNTPWGNASSAHTFGCRAKEALQESRRRVATSLGLGHIPPDQLDHHIIFTSGTTSVLETHTRDPGNGGKQFGDPATMGLHHHDCHRSVFFFCAKCGPLRNITRCCIRPNSIRNRDSVSVFAPSAYTCSRTGIPGGGWSGSVVECE